MQRKQRSGDRPSPSDPDQMLRWGQEEIFPGFWKELAALETADVCSRSGASYADEEEAYLLRMLDRVYRVNPAQNLIRTDRPAAGPASFAEALILVIYLLQSQDIPLAGRRVTEKELPGGDLFFRGPHELAREPILSRYGQDPHAFLRAGAALQGEPIPFGDAGVRFQALPRVPVECILWAGDHEFPPALTYVFDASVSDHLPLDVIWALAALLACRLAAAAT